MPANSPLSDEDADDEPGRAESRGIEPLVLDSAPMSYWRKLIIVVLLALSLPVQSFAAVSMKCVPARANAGEAPPLHAMHDMSGHHHDMLEVALADDHHPHDHGGSHHAHPCSTCASCCGAALPAVSVVVATSDVTRVVTRIPPSAGVVSFLTDGIERPPRSPLV